ncbi:hypothetical protein HYH02_015200 [Chlamydomonas schloesseri]|uniref:Uncharacterized protein n=1 Tax=Chlamydomonas schloesseri TaxID=2026947 RepID=A0A835SPP7_9CHLO|nr:hypothetical protein HYH02_015200 [Chlamydomonas schloesseri]|eukprot:KAG2424310.1 hypothetical protein HYH02_015200 [Chlamydomonas schloesseri]
MGSPWTLPEVLRVLPVDVREEVFGHTLSRQLAGSRRACRDLKLLHDETITCLALRITTAAGPFPLEKFPRAASLALDLRFDEYGISASKAISGAPEEARARITRLELLHVARKEGRSILAGLGQHLPSLESVEIRGFIGLYASFNPSSIFDDRGFHRDVLGDRDIFRGIATAVPRLRRLTVPAAFQGELDGVGALAGCEQLQQLALLSLSPCLTSEALQGLSQLTRLQELTLGCGEGLLITSGGGPPGVPQGAHLLPALLGAQRPPSLRLLRLVAGSDARKAAMQVTFDCGRPDAAPHQQQRQHTAGAAVAAAAAAAAAGATRGGSSSQGSGAVPPCPIQHVSLRLPSTWAFNLVARLLLEAADALRQSSIPLLTVAGRLHLPPASFKPQQPPGPLAALVDRCGRVELHRLPAVVVSNGTGYGGPDSVCAAVRALGVLPRALELRHGVLPLCRPVPPVATTAVVPPAPSQQPQQQQPQPQQQQLLLPQKTRAATRVKKLPLSQFLSELELGPCGGGGGGGGAAAGGAAGGAMPPRLLHLETATPEEVLAEALDRLWAEAAQGSSGSTAGGHGNGPRADACSGAGGLGKHGGSCLVLLRGKLLHSFGGPASGAAAAQQGGSDRDVLAEWESWLAHTLSACVRCPQHQQQEQQQQQQPRQRQPARADRGGGAGNESSSGCREAQLGRRICPDALHVAAPAAGTVLLQCRSAADAAALAAMFGSGRAVGPKAAAAGAAAARVGPPSRPHDTPYDLLVGGVLQVLQELWVAAGSDSLTACAPPANSSPAAAANPATHSATAAAAAAAAAAACEPATEAAVGRLRRVLALDRGVRGLWERVRFAEWRRDVFTGYHASADDYAATDPYGEDPACEGSDWDDDDGDGVLGGSRDVRGGGAGGGRAGAGAGGWRGRGGRRAPYAEYEVEVLRRHGRMLQAHPLLGGRWQW